MAEDSTSTRRASTGVCWYTFFLLVISEEGEWRQLKRKKKIIRTDKNPLFFFLPHPRNQQTSPASATINVEAVLVAKNISKNSKPNIGRANKSAWELLRKFKLLRD